MDNAHVQGWTCVHCPGLVMSGSLEADGGVAVGEADQLGAGGQIAGGEPLRQVLAAHGAGGGMPCRS